MANNDLRVNIIGDSSKLNRSLDSASKKLKKFGKTTSDLGKSLTIFATGPIALAGGAAIKLASDFQESLNKVNVAFGSSSKAVKSFAKTTLTEFGIAEGSALDMAALFGDMATSMGINKKEAADMSKSMVGLAGDLASFKNIGIDQATTALAGVFTGETESLKKLGIVMTEANLKAFALSEGIQKNVKDMTQAEKVNLRFAYILSQTTNAQGDFARTSGGAANQMRIFTEGTKQLGQSFGNLLLPAFTKIVTKLNTLVSEFISLDGKTKSIIITTGLLVGALGPALWILGKLATALAFLSGPIGIVVAGLAAIAFVIYKNWDGIIDTVVELSNKFVDLYNNSLEFRMLIEAIKVVFGTAILTMKAGVDQLINGFATLFEVAKNKFNPIGMQLAIKDGFQKSKDITKKLGEDIGDLAGTAIGNALSNRLEYTSKEKIESSFTDLKSKISSFFEWFNVGPGGGGEGGLPEWVGLLSEYMKQIGDKTTVTKEKFFELDGVIGELGEQFIFAFGQAFDAIAKGESFIKSITNALIPMIKKLIAAAAAALVLSTLLGGIGITKIKGIATSFTGIFGALTGISLGGGDKGTGGVKLASGGIVTTPTLATIGEYPGARSNPEVVAPLDKLKSMIGDRGAAQVQVGGQFTLKGQDLVVVLERANSNRNRII